MGVLITLYYKPSILVYLHSRKPPIKNTWHCSTTSCRAYFIYFHLMAAASFRPCFPYVSRKRVPGQVVLKRTCGFSALSLLQGSWRSKTGLGNCYRLGSDPWKRKKNIVVWAEWSILPWNWVEKISWIEQAIWLVSSLSHGLSTFKRFDERIMIYSSKADSVVVVNPFQLGEISGCSTNRLWQWGIFPKYPIKS